MAAQRQLAEMLPSVRWVDVRDAHLTLAFLGDVPLERLGSLGLELQRTCAQTTPFAIEISGLGVFPSPRRPRVIWVGVPNQSQRNDLRTLDHRVRQALRNTGIVASDDRFNPHITLGRFRPQPLAEVGPALKQFESWTAGEIHVAEIVLFASELSADGRIYSRLATIDLQGGNA